MANVSTCTVTLNGVDYSPIQSRVAMDSEWSPTAQGQVTLARSDLQAPVLGLGYNMIPNPSAARDLASAAGTNLSGGLARQASLNTVGSAHGTGYRLNGATTQTDSFMEVGGGSSGGMTLGMVAGQKYTASGTFYLPAVLTGATDVNGRARSIVVSVNAPSAGGLVVLAKSTASNAVGQQRVKLTFTVPADATAVWIRWYHGHQTAAECYWTDLQLTPGNGFDADGSALPFLDGDFLDTALYRYDWTGTAHNSASLRTPVFVDTFTTPVVDVTSYPKARVRWVFGDAAAPVTILDVTLIVSTYAIDDMADTVTLTLNSDEIKLQDWKLTGAGDFAPGAMLLADMIALAMRKVGGAPFDSTSLGGANPLIPATATVWRVGQSVDDWLRGALRSQGMEMYWDPREGIGTFRVWIMTNTSKFQSVGTSNVVYGVNALEAGYGTDAAAPDYGDAASLVYSWTDAAGVQQRKTYTSAPAGGYKRVQVTQLDTPDPGYDGSVSAAALAARQQYTMRVSAVALAAKLGAPDVVAWGQCAPGGLVWYRNSRTKDLLSVARSVEWNYPDDRMTFGVTRVTSNPNFDSRNTFPLT